MNKTDAILPLPTLLSHALVAFTIEFDNEFEHRMPHRTTDAHSGSGSGPGSADTGRGPWLTSMAMWGNCMRFLDDSGMHVRDLEDRALVKTNLDGMRRWGYVTLSPDPGDTRAKPPNEALVIRPTRAGRAAQRVWQPLAGEIEQRWCARFGRGAVDRLRQTLAALVSQSRRPLPCCLPILGYGLWTSSQVLERPPGADGRASPASPVTSMNPVDLELPTLLSRALFGFAAAFERGSEVSLAIGANLLRVLDQDGVRMRDLPRLTGVAKPGVEMAVGILRKLDFARVGADPDGSRWKVVQLTPVGVYAQQAYRKRLALVEEQARTRFGAPAVDALRLALEPLVGDPTGQLSPLYGGLAPYPDGWRARVYEPDTLPHFPMILHRGGYPDGS